MGLGWVYDGLCIGGLAQRLITLKTAVETMKREA